MSINKPGIGAQSFITIAREAAYGTGVATIQAMEFIESSVAMVPGFARDPSLFNQRERRGIYAAGYFFRGTIRIRANYTGMLSILDAFFGTSTFGSKGFVTTGTGPWTHKFKLLPVMNSYTIEICEGNIPITKVQRYLGAKIRGLNFMVEAAQSESGMGVIELDVIAKTKQDTQTPTASFTRSGATHTNTVVDALASTGGIFAGMTVTGTGIAAGTTVASITSATAIVLSAAATASATVTLTFGLSPAPADPLLFTQVSALNDGINDCLSVGANPLVKRVELRMGQPTTEADRLGLGSATINEPLPNNYMTPTWRFQEEFGDVSLLQAAIAGTNGTPKVKFTNGGNSIEFRSVQSRIIEMEAEPVRGYGVIEQPVGWEAFRDSTNSDVSAVYVEVVSTTEDGTFM